ncbi:MAG: hypothetical protein ACLT1X_02410 [Christensenellales bacterium]
MTHEAREAEVVRNTLAPVREKMPELDALMKAIEEKPHESKADSCGEIRACGRDKGFAVAPLTPSQYNHVY